MKEKSKGELLCFTKMLAFTALISSSATALLKFFYTETKEIFDYPIRVSGTILTCET